jgi:integrase
MVIPRNDNSDLSRCFVRVFYGVANGTRTHDNQNHNLGLYQLSYSHR